MNALQSFDVIFGDYTANTGGLFMGANKSPDKVSKMKLRRNRYREIKRRNDLVIRKGSHHLRGIAPAL